MNRCKFCGATEGLAAISGYDWDSDDDTALSITRITGYRCEWAGECADRIIERGSNIDGLAMIANDPENYFAEQVAAAKAQIRKLSEAVQSRLRGQDAAAREQGYGAIGR